MAPMGAMGPAAAGPSPSWMEPTPWEVELAVHNINAATTEQEAAKAAAAVYRIALDTPDMVVNAFEEKVARLRHPNWNRPRPPPVPHNFNPIALIAAAFREIQAIQQKEAAQQAATAAVMSAITPPPPRPPMPGPPPQPGAPMIPPGYHQPGPGSMNGKDFYRNNFFILCLTSCL